MIILEKNAKLTTMLAYAKEHIDLGDLDPAANVLRKIGEHMAKWMIIDAGLWTEACTGKNGKVYDDPTFSRCIDLLFRKHRIDKKAYTEVFAPLQNYGNVGSHKVAAVEDYQIIYTFRNVEDYVTKFFLPKYPNASRIDILPDTKNNQPAKKTSPQQTNTIKKSDAGKNEEKELYLTLIAPYIRILINASPDVDAYCALVDKNINLGNINIARYDSAALRNDMIKDLKDRIAIYCKKEFSLEEYEKIRSAKRRGELEKDITRNVYLLTGKSLIKCVYLGFDSFMADYEEGKLIPYLEKKRGKPYQRH